MKDAILEYDLPPGADLWLQVRGGVAFVVPDPEPGWVLGVWIAVEGELIVYERGPPHQEVNLRTGLAETVSDKVVLRAYARGTWSFTIDDNRP